MKKLVQYVDNSDVAPLAGAWIEIPTVIFYKISKIVAPLAGAWIEILWACGRRQSWGSLPSRERGLKFEEYSKKGGRIASLPSRERGLKCISVRM